jgi:hypothetical protein
LARRFRATRLRRSLPHPLSLPPRRNNFPECALEYNSEF